MNTTACSPLLIQTNSDSIFPKWYKKKGLPWRYHAYVCNVYSLRWHSLNCLIWNAWKYTTKNQLESHFELTLFGKRLVKRAKYPYVVFLICKTYIWTLWMKSTVYLMCDMDKRIRFFYYSQKTSAQRLLLVSLSIQHSQSYI